MRKEIVAFLVFFIFNILFAQITVVGDAQIHGAENIKIQTYQSQVFVIEGTTVYNLAEQSKNSDYLSEKKYT